MVGEEAAVGVAPGFGGVEAQHVGQHPLPVDQGPGFVGGIAPHVLQRVDHRVQEALPVLGRFAGVKFDFDVVREKEIGKGGVTGAVHGDQLAARRMLTRPPTRTPGLPPRRARGDLKGHAEDVVVGKEVLAGPAPRVWSAFEAGEVFAVL